MVSSIVAPKDFFIYGNGEKIWVVNGNSIIEIKNYMIDSFSFTMNTNPIVHEFLNGTSATMYGQKEMEFDLHALVLDANWMDKENIDVSDFYTIEEAKKLSKIIQRKFDKILEKKDE